MSASRGNEGQYLIRLSAAQFELLTDTLDVAIVDCERNAARWEKAGKPLALSAGQSRLKLEIQALLRHVLSAHERVG